MAAAKKFYPNNDILFEGKVKTQVRKKKEVVTAVTENTISFKEGVIVFKKDTALSKEELSLMTSFQKKYYLEER